MSSVLDQRTPVGTAGEAAPGAGPGLDFAMQPQQQTEWCWSAVSTSVARFYEPASSWTQCALVNEAFGQSACCREGSSAACNQPWFLERALALVQHLEKDFGGAQDMDAIAAQVAAGRPLGLCIDWTGGGGHFVVLDACDPAAGTVQVCDPMFGTSTVPLAAFPSSYQGGGTWSWTYRTRPRGGA